MAINRFLVLKYIWRLPLSNEKTESKGQFPNQRLFVRRWPRITIRPASLAWQRNRRLDPDLMAGRGAKLKDLQSPAEQIDVVDGLGALIAAIEHPRGKYVGAVLPANPDVFRAQRDAHLVARIERVQQRRLASPPLAEIDHAKLAVASDQGAGELVGGAGEIGDEQVGRPIIDLVRRAHLQQLAVAHPQAQFGVEVRQRLIEQQQLRPVDDAARQRDALHLAA